MNPSVPNGNGICRSTPGVREDQGDAAREHVGQVRQARARACRGRRTGRGKARRPSAAGRVFSSATGTIGRLRGRAIAQLRLADRTGRRVRARRGRSSVPFSRSATASSALVVGRVGRSDRVVERLVQLGLRSGSSSAARGGARSSAPVASRPQWSAAYTSGGVTVISSVSRSWVTPDRIDELTQRLALPCNAVTGHDRRAAAPGPSAGTARAARPTSHARRAVEVPTSPEPPSRRRSTPGSRCGGADDERLVVSSSDGVAEGAGTTTRRGGRWLAMRSGAAAVAAQHPRAGSAPWSRPRARSQRRAAETTASGSAARRVAAHHRRGRLDAQLAPRRTPACEARAASAPASAAPTSGPTRRPPGPAGHGADLVRPAVAGQVDRPHAERVRAAVAQAGQRARPNASAGSAIGVTGSGSASPASSTISLPSSWRTRLPGLRRAAGSSPPTRTSPRGRGSGCRRRSGVSVAAVPWMKPSSGASSSTLPCSSTSTSIVRAWSVYHRVGRVVPHLDPHALG